MKTCTLIIGYIVFFSMFTFLAYTGVCNEAIPKPSFFYVGGTGLENYTSIQDAINYASAGSTIIVFNGTYYEHVVVNKTISLMGEKKNQIIIDGDNTGWVVRITADHVQISGFTIQHSGSVFPDAGIAVHSTYNTISDNILTDNYYGMVLLSPASHNLITQNTIAHNHRCGIYFSGASYNTLIGNHVDHQPFNGFGLYDFSNDNTIVGNTLSYNNYSGVNIRESYRNNVTQNTFIGNKRGLHVPPPEFNTRFCGNFFSGNCISLEEERDYFPVSQVSFGILLLIGFFVIKRWIAPKRR